VGLDKPESFSEKGVLNLERRKLAVHVAEWMGDKLIPDKIEERKSGGAKSADDIRKAILGVFSHIGRRGTKSAAIVVEVDGGGVRGDTKNSGFEKSERIKSVIDRLGRLEGSPTDRLLRAGGGSSDGVSQEPGDPQSLIREQRLGKDDHGSDGSDLVGD
jgi:hypothetical protein